MIGDCGTQKSSSLLNYVIDGSPVQHIKERPWVVLIRNKQLNGTCTGSIISKYHILTAAHCIKVNGTVQPTSSFSVYVGSTTRLFVKQDEFSVAKATYNEHFSKGINDIAVLKLKKAINFEKYNGYARPICLPASEDRGENYVGKKGTVTGI